ncbi:MAG: PD-(D/E)XK nuclease family protein [Candidatus Pacebacteria bacterium]|nr:PD-(D/E)XK nuclease family protein [Candidatus Paceibacterota bacterium]
MRISYSSLDTFLKCPLKYKFNQIDKIEEEKAKPTVIGSFFHLIMHYIYEKDITKISLQEIEDFIKKEFPNIQYHDFSEKIHKKLTQEDLEFILEKTKTFYDTNKNKKTQTISLEEKFEITLQDKNNIHILSGIIDRFDKLQENNYEIIDYKTANKLSSFNQVSQNKQLSIYGLGILSK